jgi:hypothetical protein
MSQVPAYATLLLLIVENIHSWCVLHWHNIRNRFCENQSLGPEIEGGHTQTQYRLHDDFVSLLFAI